MKLESLYIADYRVLNDITLRFERTDPTYRVKTQKEYSLDFLAGVNGSGKTTCLQVLGRIFAWLNATDSCPVDFDLSYTLGREEEGTRRIQVTNIAERTTFESGIAALFYREGEGDWRAGKLPQPLLPNAVVIYTTGSEQEWGKVIDTTILPGNDSAEAESESPPDGIELPGHRPDFVSIEEEEDDKELDEKMLFVQSHYAPLLVLCGSIASALSVQDGVETLDPVLEDVHIQRLTAFTLRVRVHRGLTSALQQRIVGRLEQAANRIIVNGSERILQFDMAQQNRNPQGDELSIFNLYSSPIDLFRHLVHLYEHKSYYDAPLQEIRLVFKGQRGTSQAVENENQEIQGQTSGEMLQLFEWLSDGERSFLARMALFTLFREDDLLILLDEPEVHFNDVWKREIVHTLDSILSGCASHALITTHSSIALSDVHRTDILVLRRDGQLTSGSSSQQSPGIETFGADPSDILIHVFGTRSANGEHSRRFIQTTMIDLESPDELEEFSQQIAPGYWRYRIQLEAQRQRQVLQ